MPDAQDIERHHTYVARSHQLEAELAKERASNDRLRRLVGTLTEEVAALKEERQPLEVRADGALVRKDRWEMAFSAIISRFIDSRETFDVEPTTLRAIQLVEMGLDAERRAATKEQSDA